MESNPEWRRGTVLLVEPDPEERDRLGGVLEHGGFEVTICTGPLAPDYTCIGGREGDCPLVHAADLIVFDTALPGETLMRGTPAADLLAIYVASGRPVIVLGSRFDHSDPYADDGLIHLPRRPSGGSLTRGALLLVDQGPRLEGDENNEAQRGR